MAHFPGDVFLEMFHIMIKGFLSRRKKRLPAHMPNAGAPCYIKQTSLDLKGRDRFQYIYKTWGLQHSAFLNGQV